MLVNDNSEGAASPGAGIGYNEVPSVKWADLKQKLTTTGETLSKEDLRVCLRALTGSDELPADKITSGLFIDQVLGFEDYDAEDVS